MQLAFMLIGGLGFFFFGMQIMSEGLKKIAGEKLKNILNMVTKTPVVGILTGALVTCFIQSSSATSVMVVGFVNAGLMLLKQAISVIIGANIGTTFTAWLVSSISAFKATDYALPAVGIGFAISAFARSKDNKFWGQVLLGFGILFIGLEFMKDAFDPLKDSEQFKMLFVKFSDNPLLGITIGAVFTMLLQSSSATIAIIQVLAFNGLLNFESAIPLFLGMNIGTTITAQLAALGTGLNARRAAMSHTLFNFIGVAYMLIFVYDGMFARFIDFIIPGKVTLKNIMFHIAVAHSMFNVINAVVFLPFIGLLEKICIWLVPKRPDEIDLGPQYLEKHLLDTPPIALEQARKETARMLNVASESVSLAVKGFIENNKLHLKSVPKLEEAVDQLQSAITQYLIDISRKDLSEEESQELPVLIHSVNDTERIGDHSENIVELAERKIDQKLPFTEQAVNELRQFWKEIRRMMEDCETALQKDDSALAEEVLRRENIVNKMQIKMKNSHVNRLNEGRCNIKSGIVFMDFIDNLEKIGDHLTNIAQGVKNKMRWEIREEDAKNEPAPVT